MPLEFKDNECRNLESQLPDVIMQFCLILNAGLVESSAFSELASQLQSKKNTAARLFVYIGKCAAGNNTAYEYELLKAAKAIKSKSLLRFASLIIDNRNKGSELAEKLDRERQRMQSERMSNAKARAKEAETKLCFPLMLLLIVLVVICIAPAMMNM